ncbi:uncharacterized protein LOC103716052 [Phoenix dactylifera]|uniref:Uncharacterized protein LOC103716052 n=1 Tax=Phoenix dactylifera TaxID=42345 RepID=A0A8B7CME2_PHODC|nr:uncharacterized protein LOC103716052 [Phoenix dactylifera]
MANIRWFVGDGQTVRVMDNAWLSDLPLSHWPTMINAGVDADMWICELFTLGERKWHMSLINRLFGIQLVERIVAISIPRVASSDRRVWRHTIVPKVKAGDLYELYRAKTNQRQDCIRVWRLGAHHHITLFLWKVAWAYLPTSGVLCRREMNLPPSYDACPDEDSVAHVLFLCPWATRACGLFDASLCFLQSATPHPDPPLLPQ